ncbi:notchless protein homolog 1-like isoform X5 [Dysidea avara]|uniref:notchless protein homolog 1-like isoform X5 n=1 Tax=Dysidea avara TaxID=196820 RepID=UPI00331C78F7
MAGRASQYITSLRGHVSAVYQISWSADSRLLCSGSSDSTLKVWDIKNRKLLMDLPGHVDEVFSVDWSTNGEQVASGGRDRHIKMIYINRKEGIGFRDENRSSHIKEKNYQNPCRR